jgi:hypothetical protein
MRAVSPYLGSWSRRICPHTVQACTVLHWRWSIKMLRNSATLYQTARRILSEDINIYKHCCEKLKIEQDEDTSNDRSFNNVHRLLDSKRLIVMFGYFMYKKKPLGLNYINTTNSEIRKITKEAFNFPFCSFWILLLTADSNLTLQFCGNVAHLLKRRRLFQVLFFVPLNLN